MNCLEWISVLTLCAVAPYVAEAAVRQLQRSHATKLVRLHRIQAGIRRLIGIPQASA